MGAPKKSEPKCVRLTGLEIAVGQEESAAFGLACERLGLEREQVLHFKLVRKSLDLRGRRRGRAARWILHADVTIAPGTESKKLRRLIQSGRVKDAPAPASFQVEDLHEDFRAPGERRVVVVGSGPGGVFAALTLALAGVRVQLLERGAAIEQRSTGLARFHRSRVVDTESNLLYGEGGAGTYSDGKLYTRVVDPLERNVLQELVRAGAREDILWDARAHIGTDRLHQVLPALRVRLQELGVEFLWNTRFEGLLFDAGGSTRVRAVQTSKGELQADGLILAIGHSAEDTWRLLHEQGVGFEAKPFQLGVRVEHSQELINHLRHGTGPEADQLGAASYNLVNKARGDVGGAHSFCMCPGGKIVASINEDGMLCTNGMSNSTHGSPWANSAIVTTYTEQHFGPGPFAALEFRKRLEANFFEAGGGDFSAPAQRIPDFLGGRETPNPGRTSYTFGVVPGRIDLLLPEIGVASLRQALWRFDGMLEGFGGEEGLLVGIESRSSGPVRMVRDRERRVAAGFANLYSVGEGAGFAGGIMSAALDGAHSAQSLLQNGVQGN
ncbi:MAG: putative FAD-dependent dehydrogenase [Candidatus Paceibacteria bacterium]|jgi:uncharacterized FAD-dependent dehydrogenase